MSTITTVNNLWAEFRASINAAYKTAVNKYDYRTGMKLRNYAEDQHPFDALHDLLKRESAAERRHRGTDTYFGFPVTIAAKLELMEKARSGATSPQPPDPLQLLTCRPTALEAEVIGYLIRHHVNKQWLQAVDALDYPKLMNEAREKALTVAS